MFVDVGYASVNSDKVISVERIDLAGSSKLLKAIRKSEEPYRLMVDASRHLKWKSLMRMENGMIVVSYLDWETLTRRFNGAKGARTGITKVPKTTTKSEE